MPRPRTLILVAALAAALLATVIYLAATIRLPNPHHHASAPTLTAAHLRTIERALNISFPEGSTLQHATFTHGRDSVFIAQINAPAASLAAWPGLPNPPFRHESPELMTRPFLHGLPWAPQSIPPTQTQWFDNEGTSLTATEPDDTGTVLLFLWRGGDWKNFPDALRSIVPRK